MKKNLLDWIKEFYPEDPDAEWSDEKCVEHALRKWTGLRPETLAKYGLAKAHHSIYDEKGNRFIIDNETCACCVRADDLYLQDRHTDHCGSDNCPICEPVLAEDGHAHEAYCGLCPLYKARGNWACDIGNMDNGPYFIWDDTGNPEPMIKDLETALRLVKGKK